MKNKNLTIGFCGFLNYRNIIGQEIIYGINSAAKDFNINFINFASTFRNSATEDAESLINFEKKIKYINSSNIDGLIFWGSSLQPIMTMQQIENIYRNISPIPIVSIGLPFDNIPTVIADNYLGIKSLMTHLINVHGFKKIAFIGCENNYSFNERFESYKKALYENNLTYNHNLVYFIKDIDSSNEVSDSLKVFFKERKLEIKKDIEVFITINDVVAQHLVESLQNININIPADVAVVGFNNQFNCIRSYPPITTIDPNFFQLGYQTVVTLLSMINGNNKPPEKFLMPCKMVVRQSCGCLEDFIFSHEKKDNDLKNENVSIDLNIKANSENIILSLKNIIVKFDNIFQTGHAKELFDGFYDDIKNGTSHRFLNSMRKLFFDYKNVTEEKLAIWQNIISEIRNLLMPYCFSDNRISHRLENIFHQARVMIDIAYTYLNFSKKSEIYKTNALVQIATDFSIAEDLDKVKHLLKLYLKELEIPGIYLFLYDEPKDDIDSASLVFVHKKDDENIYYNESEQIPSFQILPDKRMNDKRYSTIFEILRFHGFYIGYVLFDLSVVNISIYDTLRTILNPSLYRLMLENKRNGFESDCEIQISNLRFDKHLSNVKNNEMGIDSTKVTSNTIFEYLLSHVNEPTDLEKISKDFNLSVSTVVRKTKKLTGYSIQKLHELLKVEKAKALLENDDLSISKISTELGYQNQYYFSSVFKKCTGISPKKWIIQKNSGNSTLETGKEKYFN
jgi:DNA-binding LacI/PurR family transcriptional regulator/AraC-like DNA-binding protein